MTPASSLGRLLLWLAAGIFLILQVGLWFGEGGILDVHRLKRAVAEQQSENLRLRQRNQVLEAEVNDLKNGREAIEERARLDLGMIKDDETFYLVTGKALAGSATSGAHPATPSVVNPASASAAAPAASAPAAPAPTTPVPTAPAAPTPGAQ